MMLKIFIEVFLIVGAIECFKKYIASEKTTPEHDTEWDDDVWR